MLRVKNVEWKEMRDLVRAVEEVGVMEERIIMETEVTAEDEDEEAWWRGHCG